MNTKLLSQEQVRDPLNVKLITVDTDRALLTDHCEDVGIINDHVRIILENMDYLLEAYGGLGIAAPQTGKLLRIFKIREPNLTCINPTIFKKYGRLIYGEEGCLSIPGETFNVPRYKYVSMHWYDENGQAHEKVFSNKTARIIQHEYDHLDGKLIDRFKK